MGKKNNIQKAAAKPRRKLAFWQKLAENLVTVEMQIVKFVEYLVQEIILQKLKMQEIEVLLVLLCVMQF